MSAPNKKFCCSCTPRDATFAIGILLTVFSSFSFLASLKTLVRLFCVSSIEQYFNEMHADLTEMISVSIRVIQIIVVILMVMALLQVGTNVSLIIGVMKEKAGFVGLWLLIHKVLVVLVSIAFGVIAILSFSMIHNTLVGVCFIIFGILHASIAVYFISVVGCYHAILAASFTQFSNDFIMELPRDSEKPCQTPSEYLS